MDSATESKPKGSGVKRRLTEMRATLAAHRRVGIYILIALLVGGGVYWAFHAGLLDLGGLDPRSVKYTRNPTSADLPIESVVKIVVDKDTDQEAWGSGLLFTSDGYIITNAHVVTTELGLKKKNITICITSKDVQKTACDYKAEVIDADRDADLALIKVDRGVREVQPYRLKVQEEDESWFSELIPLGTEIRAVGYPGVGGDTISVTRGIISGYRSKELGYDDGRLGPVPYFIKTDTEINFGNSGGAIFDDANRYVGIPSQIQKDDGGKIAYIIPWNRINLYLNHLVFRNELKLSGSQYIKRQVVASERKLWDGIHSYFREEYESATETLSAYLEQHDDARAANYLCITYLEREDYENLRKCAEKLRSLNPNAAAFSWILSSLSYQNAEDAQRARDAIDQALKAAPDSIYVLTRKGYDELAQEKYEDARSTAKKILNLDDLDPDGFQILGRVTLNDENYELGLGLLEASFDRRPDSAGASELADVYEAIYENSNDIEDLEKVFRYRISSVVLDGKNVLAIIRMALTAAQYFQNVPNSWGDSLKLTSGILHELGVDRELIDPLGTITDEEIRQQDIEEGGVVELSQAEIDFIHSLIDMSQSWLYTLADEKKACSSEFNKIAGVDLYDGLVRLNGLERTLARAVDAQNSILRCLCTNIDYSDTVMTACIGRTVVSPRAVQSISAPMPTPSPDANPGNFQVDICKEKYGPHAYDPAPGEVGNCNCMSGYSFSSVTSMCISFDAYCNEKWPNTYYTGVETFTCDCKPGYVWNAAETACY